MSTEVTDRLVEKLQEIQSARNSIKDVLQSKNIDAGKSILPYADLIDKLSNTEDATASASDILKGQSAYVNGQKLTGSMDLDELELIAKDILGSRGRISGQLLNEYTSNWNELKPTINLYNEDDALIKEVTINTATYSIDIEEGTYKLVVIIKGYLEPSISDIVVKSGYVSLVQDIDMSTLAGDVVKDGAIEIDDMVKIGHYNNQTTTEENEEYDLNRDGIIDMDDRNILIKNYGKLTPDPSSWEENYEEI